MTERIVDAAGAMKHFGVNKQYDGLHGVVRLPATIRSPRPGRSNRFQQHRADSIHGSALACAG